MRCPEAKSTRFEMIVVDKVATMAPDTVEPGKPTTRSCGESMVSYHKTTEKKRSTISRASKHWCSPASIILTGDTDVMPEEMVDEDREKEAQGEFLLTTYPSCNHGKRINESDECVLKRSKAKDKKKKKSLIKSPQLC